jgi:hypothetical protein
MSTISVSYAQKEPWNQPVVCASSAQFLENLGELRARLPEQVAVDLDRAILAIRHDCHELGRTGVGKEECDALFVEIINGRRPTDIIFVGACFLLAQTDEQLKAFGTSADGSFLPKEKIGPWQDIAVQRAFAIDMIKRYGSVGRIR